jgi:hypothetical protein
MSGQTPYDPPNPSRLQFASDPRQSQAFGLGDHSLAMHEGAFESGDNLTTLGGRSSAAFSDDEEKGLGGAYGMIDEDESRPFRSD